MNGSMKDRVAWSGRISYGLGNIGIAMFVTLITTFLSIYLTNVAFLDVAAVSFIMAVSRIFDGFSDLVIGNFVDRTRSKLGKARSWLLRMCLPYAFVMFLLFHVPQTWPVMTKYIYVFIMYNLVNNVIRTFISISTFSMVSLMTSDSTEQGLLGNIQSISMNLGLMCGSVLFVRLLGLFSDVQGNQNTQRAYNGAIIVFGLLMIVLTLILVLFTREKDLEALSGEGKKTSGIKETFAGLKPVLLDGNWLILVACALICSIVLQIRSTGSTYYALYILGDMGKVAWLNTFNMGASMLSQFVTPYLMRRCGMKRVFMTGIMIALLGYLGFGMARASTEAMTAFLIMGGVGNGFYHAMMPGLFATVITDISDRTGRLQAGIGNAGMSTATKFGGGLGSVIFGLLLSAAGFHAALDAQGIAQPHAVSGAISAMYIWLPMSLYGIVFLLFILFFDKDRHLFNH